MKPEGHTLGKLDPGRRRAREIRCINDQEFAGSAAIVVDIAEQPAFVRVGIGPLGGQFVELFSPKRTSLLP